MLLHVTVNLTLYHAFRKWHIEVKQEVETDKIKGHVERKQNKGPDVCNKRRLWPFVANTECGRTKVSRHKTEHHCS